MKGMLYVSVIVALFCSQGSQKQVEETKQNKAARNDYGSAVVSAVLQIDQYGMIHCNLEGFPAVIGENMPVQIKGLKPSANPQDNLPILRFLNELLLSKDEKPERVELKRIQRGASFCLLADVEVDGQDLCDLLVEKGLVKRVIEVPSATAAPATSSMTSARPRSTIPASRTSTAAIVASKTSKVYHRSSCAHAKRIEADKMVTFSSSTEAERSGRRACKTCMP